MKRTHALFAVLVVVLLLSAGCVAQPGTPKPVTATPAPQDPHPNYRVGVDADFPPFTWQAENGSYYGLDTDTARWVADREGFEVTFVALPWENAVAALNNGSVDIIWSGMTVTERAQRCRQLLGPVLHGERECRGAVWFSCYDGGFL